VFVSINYSNISGNMARGNGGGIYNWANGGVATLNIFSSTFSGNSAQFFGGGIGDSRTCFAHWTCSTIIQNSTLSGNSAASGGGGIWDSSGLEGRQFLGIYYSTLSGNSAPPVLATASTHLILG
jgi:hypothetical protein